VTKGFIKKVSKGSRSCFVGITVYKIRKHWQTRWLST